MSAVLRLETILRGHSARVRSLAFSGDGATLASAADDGTARVWDVRRGESRTLLSGHRGPVTIALSRSAKAVATAGPQEVVRLWDVESGRILSTLARPGAGGVAFAALPDRESLAVAMEQRVLLWDVPSGAINTLALEGFPNDELYYVEALAFSSDGSTLATGSTSIGWERGSSSSFESVRVWEMPSGQLRRTFPRTPPMGTLAFSPNGNMLAAGQGSPETPHEVHVWEAATGRSLTIVPASTVRASVDALAFSPNARVLAIGVPDSRLEGASVLLVDLMGISGRRRDLITTRLSLGSPASRLAISPDGKRVASAGDPGNHEVRVWSVEY